MRTLQQCLLRSWKRGFVYLTDPGSLSEYKDFENTALEAAKLQGSGEAPSLEDAKAALTTKAEAASTAYLEKSVADEEAEKKLIEGEYEKREREVVEKYVIDNPKPEKPGAALTKWQKNYDAMKERVINPMHTEREAAIAAMKRDFSHDTEAVVARIHSLEQTTIAELEAVHKARTEATAKIVTEAVQQLKEPSSENKREFMRRAEFAFEATNQRIVGGLDYDGSGSMSEKGVQDLATGFVTALYDPSRGPDDQPRVKEFLAKLRERQDSDPRSDKRVGAGDMNVVALDLMGLPTSSGTQIKSALNTPQGELVQRISGDKSVDPHVRGMMIALLAQSNKGNRDAVTKRVQSMLAVIKKYNLALPGSIESSVWDKSEAAMNAYNVFNTVLNAVSAQDFLAAKGRYDSFVAITKTEDEAVKKIIADSNIPELMAENLPALEKAITAAEQGYRERAIRDLEGSPDLAKARAIYEYFGATFRIDADIINAKTLEPLKVFVANLQALQQHAELEALMSGAEISSAALEYKNKFNNLVQRVNAFKLDQQKKRKTLPTELAADFAEITAITPDKIMEDASPRKEALKAAGLILKGNTDKPTGTPGGGGLGNGGSPSGTPSSGPSNGPTPAPAPASPETPAANVKVERLDKLPDNFNNANYELVQQADQLPEDVKKTPLEKDKSVAVYRITKPGEPAYYAYTMGANGKPLAETAYYKPKTAPTPPTMTAQNPPVPGPAEGPNPAATS